MYQLGVNKNLLYEKNLRRWLIKFKIDDFLKGQCVNRLRVEVQWRSIFAFFSWSLFTFYTWSLFIRKNVAKRTHIIRDFSRGLLNLWALERVLLWHLPISACEGLRRPRRDRWSWKTLIESTGRKSRLRAVYKLVILNFFIRQKFYIASGYEP